MIKFSRKALSLAIAALTVALSPGPEAYAAVSQGRAVPGRVLSTPTIPTLNVRIPQLGFAATKTIGSQTIAAIPTAPTIANPIAAARPSATPLAQAAPLASARPTAPRVLASLQRGAEIAAPIAAPGASAEQNAAASGALFQGSAERPAFDLSIPNGRGRATPSRLLPPGRDGPSKTSDEPERPRQDWTRSMRWGLVVTVANNIFFFASVMLAGALGYQFHPNYKVPIEANNAPSALALFAGAVILAPIAEEIITRVGIMGGIRKMTGWIPAVGKFLIPAILSSLIFVVVHETSDPLLFGLRFIHSMAISYLFYREGVAATIFQHAFHNLLAVSSLILFILFPPVIASLASLALSFGSLWAAWAAWKRLKAEKPDVDAGRLAPFQISPRVAVVLAVILAMAVWQFMFADVWVVGAIGWLIYALAKRRSSAAAAP